MANTIALDAILKGVAAASLKGRTVSRVLSEPTSGSDGEDAVLVTVVFAGGKRYIDGDLALDAITDLNQALQQQDDPRTPIITFVREDELESDVDSESESSF